jgi:hypothetical protein
MTAPDATESKKSEKKDSSIKGSAEKKLEKSRRKI